MKKSSLVLYFPPGETFSNANLAIAKEILDKIQKGIDVVIPSEVDAHGNRLWELNVVVSDSEGHFEIRKAE